MKIIQHIKKIFNITFALYTCVSFGMMIFNRVLSIEQAPTWSGVAMLFGQIGLFAALTALAHTLFDIPKALNKALAHLMKFVCSYGAFYLCFFVLVKSVSEPINIVVMSTIFVVLYAVVAVLAGLFAKLGKTKKNEDYESIYTKE